MAGRNRSAVPPTFAAVLFPQSARTRIPLRTSVLPRTPDYSEDNTGVPKIPSLRPADATKYCGDVQSPVPSSSSRSMSKPATSSTPTSSIKHYEDRVQLTLTEAEYLQCLADGMTFEEMAGALGWTYCRVVGFGDRFFGRD